MAGKGRKSEGEEAGFRKMKEELKEMISDMFKTHEKNVVNILTANNKIMNERIDKLTSEQYTIY